ncbi:PTS sugar transporter subunit IIB [Cytobacillus sp. Hz8]|uniref:PTS sugar transporter subunit IIB n=1 Tax=Cytobacillus sp. Hz8 TaxID=3347168 RepID=UPI0035D9C2F3
MIKLMRIDERLIHGQVAVVWSKQLDVNRIIVADDDVVKNETQMMALKMAVPSNIKATIVEVDKAIALINDPRAAALKIFVIVSNPKTAYRLANEVEAIPAINIGNFGRMSSVKGDEQKEKIGNNFYVDSEDKVDFLKLKEFGIPVYYQNVPTDQKKDVEGLLK